MHRQTLLKLLAEHQTRFMEEAAYIRKAKEFVSAQPDCFYRELWPAHVTGSAWVVSPDRTKAMMLHHRKHDQWFQPGGHADGDNESRKAGKGHGDGNKLEKSEGERYVDNECRAGKDAKDKK